ncbi:hypothetical protein SUGI_0552870 [Cryptomeria japonica]|nr:hypothetical protein SUGI_0552870 [Cryptomeria japonica]
MQKQKRYTNNFAVRLGQGGFGTVFKGEVPNGCMVAIKILDKSKHSRIQFMNEVVTIGRIHQLHLLYSIAMGTARGIACLHDECGSRILHCDIKPHNVLLDANFSPKVVGFGLAKLTNREESHVSLTGARGTPGYAAPEVWSKTKGPVIDR